LAAAEFGWRDSSREREKAARKCIESDYCGPCFACSHAAITSRSASARSFAST
jgi:hypothetical protein